MSPTKLLLVCIVFSGSPLAAEEKIPWPEHPRPDFMREPWVNLNGKWKFAFDPSDVGVKEGWFRPGQQALGREIVVPFPWESKLSGIGDTEYKGVAWYAREIEIPAGEGWNGKDAWLIVGACDWEAKAWVNGVLVKEHVGGYLPFEVNLAKFATPGDRAHIVIRAADHTDPQQPTGKQVGWYTRNSGIWQTVYLEARGKKFIRSFKLQADVKTGTVRLKVTLEGDPKGVDVMPTHLRGVYNGPVGTFSGEPPTAEGTMGFQEFTPWTPESPVLQPLFIELVDHDSRRTLDEVETYFGFREISIAKAPGREYQYIHLNGNPIYLAGALHQSFHPDGIYQYPDDATMRGDYELCKKIGINTLRIHIKTPIPRELYWADKLGVLIMQDIPNFWKYTPQAQDWFEQLLRGAIARDFNHPSIFAWVDFNETWGIEDGGYTPEHQKWVERMYRLTKELDPTRPVEDNSPCKYDHTVTDINSWHFYINDYEQAKKHIAEVVEKTHPGSTFNYAKGYTQRNEPLMNSEYGGISAGLGDQDISWCFKYLTNELRKHDKVCGYIYTELSDIEWEHNGFVNYDRSEKEFGYDFWHPGMTLKDINGPDFVVIDAPPMIELKPGVAREVPIKISHWSEHEAKDLQLRWRIADPLMERFNPSSPALLEHEWKSRPAQWKRFEVVDQKPISASVTMGRLTALLVELRDGEKILTRNYVNLLTDDSPPGIEARGPDWLIITLSPGDYAERTFTAAVSAAAGSDTACVSGQGSGLYQYDLALPRGARIERVSLLQVGAELASWAGDAKLDWPARRTPHDRPQTDGKKWPSDVTIRVNGVNLIQKTLPDDPADARGALSHHRGLQGGYGYWTKAEAMGSTLEPIMSDLKGNGLLRVQFRVPPDAAHPGGLRLYGPVLVSLRFEGGHDLPEDFRQPRSPTLNRAVERLLVPIATAEAGGHEWQFRVERPAEGWMAHDFDASGWRTGRGGFGSRGTPGAIIGTRWSRPEIWLRTQFKLDDPEPITGGSWRLHHDEDVEIYLNGRKVLERQGFISGYMDLPLDPTALEALRAGENVVAVHCRQTSGGQNIDVGLTLTRQARK